MVGSCIRRRNGLSLARRLLSAAGLSDIVPSAAAKWRNGRRTRLKIERSNTCGFESHLGHLYR
jgi:hypothetical protein